MDAKRVVLLSGLLLGATILSPPCAFGTAMSYHPLTPCRIVDTRVGGAGGPLAAGEVRGFSARGGFGQGAGNTCTDFPTPNSVLRAGEAITVNLVAVSAAGPGDLRVFPANLTAAPLASVVNYVAGQTIAVGTTIPLGADGNGNDFKVQADVSGTDVVIDLMGYYSRAVSTTYTAFLTALPASTGATITRFGQITGAAPASSVKMPLAIPIACTAQQFKVQETAAQSGPGSRVYTLKMMPDFVVQGDCNTAHVGSCESPSPPAIADLGPGSILGGQLFIETFNTGAVAQTDAFVTFELTCQ